MTRISNFAFGGCGCCRSSSRCPDANGTLIGSYRLIVHADGSIEERTSGGGIKLYPVSGNPGVSLPAITQYVRAAACLRMTIEMHYSGSYTFETVIDGNLELVTIRNDEFFDNVYGVYPIVLGSYELPTIYESIREDGDVEHPNLLAADGYCEERFKPVQFDPIEVSTGGLRTWKANRIEYIFKAPQNPTDSPGSPRGVWTKDNNGNLRNLIFSWNTTNLGMVAGLTMVLGVYAIGDPLTGIPIPDNLPP